MSLVRIKKYAAEFIGTMILVTIGCGTAIATATNTIPGVNVVATALAFGIALIIVAYSVGRISGAHVNPAVSLGVFINGGMDWIDLAGYVIAQLLGAFAGSALLGIFFGGYANTGANYCNPNTFGVYAPAVAFAVEIVLTFFFVFVILGVTEKKEYSNIAGLVIGIALTGMHLLGISIDGTSVNPARSLSSAIFSLIGGNGEQIGQIWVYILAPLVGAALAAVIWRFFFKDKGTAASPANI